MKPPAHYLRLWRRWWRLPDQSLLRQEVRWGLRWFFHPPGAYCLASIFLVYVALNAVAFAFMRHNQAVVSSVGTGVTAPANLILMGLLFTFFVMYLTLIFRIWLFTIHRRIFRYFHPSRLSDLLVTTLRPPQLFPALLAGPIVVSCMLHLVSWVLGILAELLQLRMQNPMDEPQAHPVFQILIKYEPLGLLVSWGLSAAVIAYAVSRTLPSVSWLRLLAYFFLASFCFSIPGVLISGAVDKSSDLTLQLLLSFSADALIGTLAILLWRRSIKRLRSPELFAHLTDSLQPIVKESASGVKTTA